MKKTCAQCGQTFECHSDNITKCHCYSVKITNKQIKKLKMDYKDCLCNICLRQLINQ